jgi:hypothetical protein
MDIEARNTAYHARRALGVEKLPSGETRGLDPREMPKSLLREIGHKPTPLLKAVRAKCLECSHGAHEVRCCTAVDCALWPFRMGTNPFRAEKSEEARRADGERLAAARRGRGAEALPLATEESAA